MRTRILVASIAMLAAVGNAPAPALGQQPKPEEVSAADKARAKKLFDQAEAHKRRGDELSALDDVDGAHEAWGKAADLYFDAYRIYDHPAFIYNLAQVRRLRGEHELALRAYRTYLRRDPDGAQAAQARAFIAELEAKVPARQDRSAGTDTGDAGDTRTDDTGSGKTGTTTESASGTGPGTSGSGTSTSLTSSTTGAAGSTDTGQPRPGRGLRLTGLSVAAVGLVGLGVGIKFGLDARAASDDLSEPRDGWDMDDPQRVADGGSAERNMIIAVSVGSAAVATGAVLYYLGHRAGQRSERLAIVPSVTPDSLAMVLAGRF